MTRLAKVLGPFPSFCVGQRQCGIRNIHEEIIDHVKILYIYLLFSHLGPSTRPAEPLGSVVAETLGAKTYKSNRKVANC